VARLWWISPPAILIVPPLIEPICTRRPRLPGVLQAANLVAQFGDPGWWGADFLRVGAGCFAAGTVLGRPGLLPTRCCLRLSGWRRGAPQQTKWVLIWDAMPRPCHMRISRRAGRATAKAVRAKRRRRVIVDMRKTGRRDRNPQHRAAPQRPRTSSSKASFLHHAPGGCDAFSHHQRFRLGGIAMLIA
jgi:hypothetical protein